MVRGVRTYLREHYGCDRCRARPGEWCVSETGRRQAECHASRWRKHNLALSGYAQPIPLRKAGDG